MNNNLEIIIPTWNRAKYLDNTLSQFANSPFANYKITILDNASSDETSNVCKQYSEVFPNLKIIRNNKNIGGLANIFRCYEIAEAKYLWLVGDNDNYDFSDCSEVINIIEHEDYDLIFIEQIMYQLDIKKTNVHELFKKGHGNRFIRQMATISDYIIKTELLTSECIQEGYKHFYQLYPQFVFADKACKENFSIFISESSIRLGDVNPHVSYDILELVYSWITANLMLEKKYQKYGIETFLDDKPILYSIIGSIMSAKANDIENYRETMNKMMRSIIKIKGIFIGLMYATIMLLVSFIPKRLTKFILDKINANK